MVAAEKLAEKTFAAIGHRVAEHEHHFLVREPFRTAASHAMDFQLNGCLSWHARIIVAGRF